MQYRSADKVTYFGYSRYLIVTHYRHTMQKFCRFVINCNQMIGTHFIGAAFTLAVTDFSCFSLHLCASGTNEQRRICFNFFTDAPYFHNRRWREPAGQPFVTFINQNGLLRLFCATRPCKGSGGRDRLHGRQKPRRNAVQRGFPIHRFIPRHQSASAASRLRSCPRRTSPDAGRCRFSSLHSRCRRPYSRPCAAAPAACHPRHRYKG